MARLTELLNETFQSLSPSCIRGFLDSFFFFFFPGEALVKGQMKPTRKEMKAAGGLQPRSQYKSVLCRPHVTLSKVCSSFSELRRKFAWQWQGFRTAFGTEFKLPRLPQPRSAAGPGRATSVCRQGKTQNRKKEEPPLLEAISLPSLMGRRKVCGFFSCGGCGSTGAFKMLGDSYAIRQETPRYTAPSHCSQEYQRWLCHLNVLLNCGL